MVKFFTKVVGCRHHTTIQASFVAIEPSAQVPGDLFTVFIVILNCPPWNTDPLKGPAAGNIEVFINEASASAVKVVVVAAVREALLIASVAALYVEGFELIINDRFFCCSLETKL